MNKQSYNTTDISLAAYLSLRHKTLGVQDANERRATFIFEGDETAINDDVDKFYKREGMVEPREFFDAIRSMKSMLYNAKESNYGEFRRSRPPYRGQR